MKKRFKKILCMMLAITMIYAVVFSAPIAVTAADTQSKPTVEIVSFTRGSQTNLRSSELLEARITGYDGNVQNLTYEWINGLGTYLYVYNSHNMYYINNTAGEVEIYNSAKDVDALGNMGDRSFDKSYKEVGFRYAAVYGAYSTGWLSQPLVGTVTVNVYDENDTLLCSDSHTGRSGSWGSTTGFTKYSISDDLDDVTIGLFEGDERNVKDLLGESAILHITCVESNVNKGTIKSGTDHIKLTQPDDYYIKGVSAGPTYDTQGNIIKDAEVELTIQKKNCKFHNNTSGTATTSVFVFKKPTTSTTAYTLTLDNLDVRCDYYIDGIKGKDVLNDKGERVAVVFENLTPNTQYMVEVEAEFYDEKYKQNRYTYAYVYDTTKPIYTGTVEAYLNGTYDSATHTVIGGEKVDVSDVTPYSGLCAIKVDGGAPVVLEHKEKGVYSNILDDGTYNIYYYDPQTKETVLVDDQILTMQQSDRTRYIFYNTVHYYDGTEELKDELYVTNTSVNVWDETPVKEGHVFVGWEAVWVDENNVEQRRMVNENDILTSNISTPYALYAVWEEGIDVKVNFTIKHKTKNDGVYADADKDDITFDLMSRPVGSTSNYADVIEAYVVSDHNIGYVSDDYEYTYNSDKEISYFDSKSPVLTNVRAGQDYSVEVAKTHYEIESVNQVVDETTGDVTLDVVLKYDPKNANLEFTVKFNEEQISLLEKYPEYKPTAVNVKVLTWYSSGHKEIPANVWEHISQHHDTFVTLTFAEDSYEATGTYPVWMHNSGGDEYYYYRIKVVSYVLPDGRIIASDDKEGYENIEYITEDDRYHAVVTVTDGDVPSKNTTLEGAHFNTENGDQKGAIEAVINIHTYDIRFEPDGGKFSDNTSVPKTITEQIEVPELSPFTPTKDGGYIFEGWYLVENGEITDKTVNSGDTLTSNITLRAKWRKPLVVEGVISVAGYYHLNDDENEIRIINEPDRTKTVTVYLQKILPNGYAQTVSTQTIDIDYSDLMVLDSDEPVGLGEYSFTTVPDDGSVYRIYIHNPNYTVKYQNEDESLDPAKKIDYDNYYHLENEGEKNHFMAEFGTQDVNKANVNAYLEFTPHEFDLNYLVNASQINEGYRPVGAEVLVHYMDLYDNPANPQSWTVISQMTTEQGYIGNDTEIDADGISDIHSYPVWQNLADGHSLYDYSVSLDGFTILRNGNSEDIEFNPSTAPFYVSYNGSARLDTITGKPTTDPLTINLIPRRYAVEFDLGVEADELSTITNFDQYKVAEGYYETTHIWSFDTDISKAKPQRSGYRFMGWYYEEEPYESTIIDASVAQDIVLTAKWEEIDRYKVTFHANNEYIGYDVFRTYYPSDVVTPDGDFALNTDNTISQFYEIPQFTYETHNNFVFKGWYVDTDSDSKPDTPINFGEDKFPKATDIYAMWIEAEDVAQAADDKKITLNNGFYPGFDLMGVQIRTAIKDEIDHVGTVGAGLRYVTVLNNDTYNQINMLDSRNTNGAEYGYALAKRATAEKYSNGDPYHEIQYKGSNVNGVNTNKSHVYVSNLRCSGVPDHFESDGYRLYTGVITYNNADESLVAQAKAQEIIARSYIRYYDANGLLRTHYNNYIKGNGEHGIYSGCSASYDATYAMLNQK